MRKRTAGITRIETGIRTLDALLHGGLPKGSITLIAGPPGAGKTILTQQICFHNASPAARVLYFSTLSEPTAKTLLYLGQFDFFDPAKFDECVRFVDLGVLLRRDGLDQVPGLVMEHVKKVKPAIVVVDSFKVFDDMARSREDLRKFSYTLAVKLMAWECTALLLGEYGAEDIQTNPLFSIIDGLVTVTRRELSGEQQRFLQIHKMRGTDHILDEQSFVITSRGIEIFAPRVAIQRKPETGGDERCKTGISRLDELLCEGILRGSSLLVGGVAGTGKTLLLLEFLYRGACAGEKGILFAFEQTREQILTTARGFGWDLEREIERGRIELVFVPQPDIMVDSHILMIRERVQAMGARRVAIDSVSVFLHKIEEPRIAREKMFHLASIVYNAGAVGFFATDIPYGASQISRFGVEETVVDGVILLSASEDGLDRRRYIEVYKLRNAAHLLGRHAMMIGEDGITVFPRYGAETWQEAPPIETSRRLSTGVEGLDGLLGGGLLERSATLITGSAGIGKTTLGVQFVLEGARLGERGIYVTLEEGPAQLLESADALALPLRRATGEGLVEILHLGRGPTRAPRLLAILGDKIRDQKVRRVVLDGTSHMVSGRGPDDELVQLLHSLVDRFKRLGVTSLLTLESESLYSTELASGRGLSPVTDNLVLLRYDFVAGRLQPNISVIKTRGSSHDRNTHRFEIGRGGVRIEGDAVDGPQGSGAVPGPARES